MLRKRRVKNMESRALITKNTGFRARILLDFFSLAFSLDHFSIIQMLGTAKWHDKMWSSTIMVTNENAGAEKKVNKHISASKPLYVGDVPVGL